MSFKLFLRNAANIAIRQFIVLFQRSIALPIAYALRMPQLSQRLNHWLFLKYPALHGHLLKISQFHGPSAYKKFTPDFSIISYKDVEIYFFNPPLADKRGIGRVTREILSQLKNISQEKADKDTESGTPKKRVYFYSSIHWCPDELPAPSVVMIHDVTPLVLPEIFPLTVINQWKSRFKRIAEKAEKIITISQSSAIDIHRNLLIAESKIKVIYNGISDLRAGDGKNLRLPDREYFVFLGTYDHHKNLDVVLHALTQPDAVGFDLALIGNNLPCKRKVKELRLERRVFFLGPLQDEDAAFVIKKATALVFPSLYEGFGLPPLEAAKLGVPSICSARPAMDELLVNATLFADPHSPEDWAKAMSSISKDPVSRESIAAAAGEIAHSLNWESSSKELIRCLVEIAADSPGRQP